MVTKIVDNAKVVLKLCAGCGHRPIVDVDQLRTVDADADRGNAEA